MANKCKTCAREDVDEINKQITTDIPLRVIASNCDIPYSSMQRHKETCLRTLFNEVREEKRAGLLADIDEVKDEIVRIAAEFADNGNVQVQLVARRLDAIDKEAKLVGAYVKEKDNLADAKAVAQEVIRSLTEQGYPEAEVRSEVRKLYPDAIEVTATQ